MVEADESRSRIAVDLIRSGGHARAKSIMESRLATVGAVCVMLVTLLYAAEFRQYNPNPPNKITTITVNPALLSYPLTAQGRTVPPIVWHKSRQGAYNCTIGTQDIHSANPHALPDKGPPLVTLSEFDGVRAGHEPETAQSNSRWTLRVDWRDL
jgi:hypothetical protein